jgi:hypothetical protein
MPQIPHHDPFQTHTRTYLVTFELPHPPPLPLHADNGPTLHATHPLGSSVLSLHTQQAFATATAEAWSTGALGPLGRIECVAVNPVGSDVAFATRVVATATGPRRFLVRLNMFTGEVTSPTATGAPAALTINPTGVFPNKGGGGWRASRASRYSNRSMEHGVTPLLHVSLQPWCSTATPTCTR